MRLVKTWAEICRPTWVADIIVWETDEGLRNMRCVSRTDRVAATQNQYALRKFLADAATHAWGPYLKGWSYTDHDRRCLYQHTYDSAGQWTEIRVRAEMICVFCYRPDPECVCWINEGKSRYRMFQEVCKDVEELEQDY